jgi:hypothetical protein
MSTAPPEPSSKSGLPFENIYSLGDKVKSVCTFVGDGSNLIESKSIEIETAAMTLNCSSCLDGN